MDGREVGRKGGTKEGREEEGNKAGYTATLVECGWVGVVMLEAILALIVCQTDGGTDQRNGKWFIKWRSMQGRQLVKREVNRITHCDPPL